MTLEIPKKHIRNELKAGVHLVMIHSVKVHLDDQKNPIKNNGEIALLVTFVTGQEPNMYHDQVYWIGKGEAGKERFFTKMCIDAGIDMSITPMTEKMAKNKRVWIAIREVYTLINNGADVLKDIGGNEVREHFIFNTAPVHDASKAPTWKGDPAKNNRQAADEFVGYRYENETAYETIKSESGPALEVLPATQEQLSEATIEAELNKVAAEARPDPNGKTKEEILNGPSGIQMNKTIMPNFGEPENKDLTENEFSEALKQKEGSLNFGSETPAPEVKVETPIVAQNTSNEDKVKNLKELQKKAMPNFGGDETPDSKF